MVKFYVNRIKRGLMELEEVPPKWYKEVKVILEAETE